MIGSPNEEAVSEAQVQSVSGHEHLRTIDPTNTILLKEILAELKKISTQMSFVTDEEL